VEKLALTASTAGEHAVSTRADASKGERLVLFTTDAALGREALQASAKTLGLPELAIPKVIVHVKALPLLGPGKVDYVALKRMAEEETPS
jgi:acyl-[acyl-carrier-protein]-phospholipid O-acyltransferase/long-chain-fatty-acid--[acyl-carrier-protein] ligase